MGLLWDSVTVRKYQINYMIFRMILLICSPAHNYNSVFIFRFLYLNSYFSEWDGYFLLKSYSKIMSSDITWCNLYSVSTLHFPVQCLSLSYLKLSITWSEARDTFIGYFHCMWCCLWSSFWHHSTYFIMYYQMCIKYQHIGYHHYALSHG